MRLKPAKFIPMPKIKHEIMEKDFYSETGTMLSLEDDSITLEEEAFMRGYLNS